MSKHANDQHDKAERAATMPDGITMTVPGETGPAPEPDRPRLHKIPALCTKNDRRDILRAVTLKLATLAITSGDEDEEENGKALACIAREWNQAEALRLREKGSRA